MKKISEKLTILIPTYKRHKELKKKIEYLKNFYFKVLIIDGSPKPLEQSFIKKFKHITYFHLPVENRYDRIFFANKLIKTKYVKLEADNDYFPPSSLIRSIKYLEVRKEYSAVIGKCGIYSKYKKKIYIKELFKKHESLTQDDLFLRMKNYMNDYSPALYHSVLRVDIFKKQINTLNCCKRKYGDKFDMMAEFCVTFICCAYGKVKKLDQITWIRSDDEIKFRKDFIGIKKLIGRASNYQNLYGKKMNELFKSGHLDNYFSILSDEISNKKKNPDSKNKIKKIFLDYLIIAKKRNDQFKKNAYLINILKSLIPSAIKKYLRFFLRINGPSLMEVVSLKIKVDYKFYKNELREINKFLLRD